MSPVTLRKPGESWICPILQKDEEAGAHEGRWLCRVTGLLGGSILARLCGDLVTVSPPLPAVPTQPKAAAASRRLCGAAGSVPGPAGMMGTTCSWSPRPWEDGHGALQRSGVMQAGNLCEPFGSGLPNRTQLPLNGSGGSSRRDVSCVLASPTSWCSGGRPFRSFSWITRMLPNGPPGACLAFLQPAHCSVAGIIM